MAKRMFVGNLPWQVDTKGLVEILTSQDLAYLNALVLTDRDTGKSRGFGFVQFETDADFAEAQGKLSGLVVQGRALVANEAAERPQRVDRRQRSFKFTKGRLLKPRGDEGGDW